MCELEYGMVPQGLTRRRALRALAGGMGGALLAAGAARETSAAAASGSTALGGPGATSTARTAQALPAALTAETLGQSQGGLGVQAFWLGDGPRAVVVQGALHGGPESNTSALTFRLRDHFAANPDQIPAGMRLAFIPEANPDGIAADTRLYLSGVDPNRNWDTPDWDTDAYDSNGAFRRGLGGPRPMSEPETRWLADWLLALRPAVMVQYHSRGGFVVGSRDLAEPYAAASGYYLPPPPQPGGGSIGRLLPYRATGSLGRWLGTQGIPSVFIELTNHSDPEFNRNLAGLRAVLRAL